MEFGNIRVQKQARYARESFTRLTNTLPAELNSF
jgi:hypothetical protein